MIEDTEEKGGGREGRRKEEQKNKGGSRGKEEREEGGGGLILTGYSSFEKSKINKKLSLIEKQAKSKNFGEIQCPICLEEFKGARKKDPLECGHMFCKEVWYSLLPPPSSLLPPPSLPPPSLPPPPPQLFTSAFPSGNNKMTRVPFVGTGPLVLQKEYVEISRVRGLGFFFRMFHWSDLCPKIS
jgi:hypothetical protein